MIRSSDEDTDFFEIVEVVLQIDTLAPYFFYTLPKLSTWNIDRSNKRKWFHIKTNRSRWYPAGTIIYAEYIDDLALLAYTSAKSLLHSVE